MKLEKTVERLEVRGSCLSGSVFDDVNISGASFENANMSGWMVNNANLAGLRVTNADVAGVQIADCRNVGHQRDRSRRPPGRLRSPEGVEAFRRDAGAILREKIAKEARVMTDEAGQYRSSSGSSM